MALFSLNFCSNFIFISIHLSGFKCLGLIFLLHFLHPLAKIYLFFSLNLWSLLSTLLSISYLLGLSMEKWCKICNFQKIKDAVYYNHKISLDFPVIPNRSEEFIWKLRQCYSCLIRQMHHKRPVSMGMAEVLGWEGNSSKSTWFS